MTPSSSLCRWHWPVMQNVNVNQGKSRITREDFACLVLYFISYLIGPFMYQFIYLLEEEDRRKEVFFNSQYSREHWLIDNLVVLICHYMLCELNYKLVLLILQNKLNIHIYYFYQFKSSLNIRKNIKMTYMNFQKETH